MATAQELTDPHLSTYVPPPSAGVGVCQICHGSSGHYTRCWSCKTTLPRVTYPLRLVVPALTRTDLDAQLHNVLRDYKYAGDSGIRERHRYHLAALLLRFLTGHRACIERAAGGTFQVITVVPSKQGRTGVHPLEQAVGLTASLATCMSGSWLPGPASLHATPLPMTASLLARMLRGGAYS